ncbi:MAG: KpsF/GutQ family sugar-phosphate isomerase [Sphingobium sp.]|nr:KpsF/GutQ family sugar-phosphate isomerase [Sphingobium sp.]
MGRRAIATEAEALWSLAHVDQSFAEAVSLIRGTRGRLIVCGLGKSGHIARKLTATFVATGTPALFLHAGEAIHGDLGVLMRGDTLLILSNSGDTREFGVVIRQAEGLAIPIIAITSNVRSAIALSADILLALPAKPEACPFGSTPTTSTTMMLALGDALAVTLLQLRGLSPADLLVWHPGGRLGLDLLPVDRFMHHGENLPFIAAEASMFEAIHTISDKGFGIAAVVNDQRHLLGVISDGDIRRNIHALPGATAGEIMTSQPRTLVRGAMARDALATMSGARITSVFVLEDEAAGEVAGLVHIHDLLRLGIG